MSDPRQPDDGPTWPEHDLSERGALDAPDAPRTEAAPPVTGFADDRWNRKVHGERRKPTTAEQAVPWLIGIVLALTGMLIVLLALIFTGPEGLSAISSPTPTPSADAVVSGQPTPGAEPSSAPVTPTPVPSDTPAPTPTPSYGPLEMVYLGRPSSLAPIHLLRRDFSTGEDPRVMAQADEGIDRFAWAPDGRVGVGLISGRAVALTPGKSARRLVDRVDAISFGWDAETVYAVRILQDGANDRAQILTIDFASGAAKTLASVRYPHPQVASESALKEAKFIDDGGLVRIYPTADGLLVAWILGAPASYRIDPGDGSLQEVAHPPLLWSPDGRYHIGLTENADGTTIIRRRERTGKVGASITVDGLVSHVRWAPGSNEIVFTLGSVSATGGVRQDLYVWDLKSGSDPLPLTSDGVSFGAEWLGTLDNWVP
jgi:hypothetical protein